MRVSFSSSLGSFGDAIDKQHRHQAQDEKFAALEGATFRVWCFSPTIDPLELLIIRCVTTLQNTYKKIDKNIGP